MAGGGTAGCGHRQRGDGGAVAKLVVRARLIQILGVVDGVPPPCRREFYADKFLVELICKVVHRKMEYLGMDDVGHAHEAENPVRPVRKLRNLNYSGGRFRRILSASRSVIVLPYTSE